MFAETAAGVQIERKSYDYAISDLKQMNHINS